MMGPKRDPKPNDTADDASSPMEPETVVVQDSWGEAEALLDDDLPDEALELLFHTDGVSQATGPLRFDRAARRWVSSDG